MLRAIRLLLAAAFCAVCQCATNVAITNHWNGGFQGEPCIPITKELNGWRAHLLFSEDVDTIEVWAAEVTKLTPRDFLLINKDYDAQQHVGDQLCFTFVARVNNKDITPTVTLYIEGMDGPGSNPTQGPQNPVGTSAPNTGGGSARKDYAKALGNSILFYDAQRSGRLPSNNPIRWRGDSAVNDCVPGGWYDAGDHVKFGLPMASSTTLLLWSLYRFKDGYAKAGQLDMMYDMIKWPLDYFLKAWKPQSRELVVQVGDGNADHSFWGRPEDMNMARPCQTVSSSNKGSDIAGETAAALAVGSIVFKEKGDTSYSTQLLTAAESLFAFAKSNRGIFRGSAPFYSSSADQDEMCVAAAWLYRATRNNQYLNDANSLVEDAWAWALGWDDKKIACQLILYEETQKSTLKDAVVGFMQSWLPGGGITYTPCGLAWRDQWGANRYAGNSAFLALLAAEAGINTADYRKWAVEQINYILGDNNHDGGCYSFQIGYGSKFPRQPHHRGASCPDRPAPCSGAQLNDPGPSPQILVGAIVGGPEANDNYRDVRTDYILNEVATDYNSGFQGALAGIVHLQATNNLPVTHNKCQCNG
uniref:Endoglucanase n=1 Tax=Biomphalaria glabrata TaxID=6526 RepID=A0A2C9KE36_BIOGL